MRFYFNGNNISNMNNLLKYLILWAILISIGVSYYFYRTRTYVTAEFRNLRPFHDRAPIYYNGFKIGKVVKVRPNKTYTATIVTLRLHPMDLKLPVNITANLKREKNKKNDKYDYIDIIYPQNPSSFLIKDGDRIAGKSSVELDSYLSNQDPDSLDDIKEDFAQTVKNLNITVQALGDLFGTINSIAEDVKPNVVQASSALKDSSGNFVKISENVSSVTGNINGTFDKQAMNSANEDLLAVGNNVKIMTDEFSKTVPQIGCTINELNRVLCNIDEMTEGLNCTMKKPFGGLRLIFGSPVSTKKCNCE